MVKLVKIRYIGGRAPGFEHVMKEELARVLERRGQVEIVPEEAPKEPKSKRTAKTVKPEAEAEE